LLDGREEPNVNAMTDPIRLTIRGQGAETDAPTVEDLVAQIEDWSAILERVEEAIAEDGAREIEWRVTGASKNSPLKFELTPFPRRHGMNIEQREREVKQQVARGLFQLQSKAERPIYFTEPVLEKAERLFERVTNGLNLTRIEFGDNLPEIEITSTNARSTAANIISVRKPKDKPYREIGSVEGTLRRVERDGHGRPLLYVKLRLDGETVKCIAHDSARSEVERHEIADIWKNKRVRVFGTIFYRALGHITQLEADAVQFMGPKEELPRPGDIIDENFTGGLKSEEYLERLRGGDLA
jgi:hypothetical protein